MKFKRTFHTSNVALLGLGIFLFIASCSRPSKNDTVQIPGNWVVLTPEDAQEVDGALHWDFQLSYSGACIIQVLRDGVREEDTVSVEVHIDDEKIISPLKKSFVINTTTSPETVSDLEGNLVIKQKATHHIAVKSPVPFSKVRIIPHYRNPIGTREFYDQWLAMHTSPEKQAAMAWFKEAKYGMFIHWGLYSQAGGIWKDTRVNDSPHPGPKIAEWLMFAFRISREEYKELAKDFNPDKSFATNFVKLAKDAGMKYMVITSKHHDGFALFDSKVSEYDMVDATPYGADAIKELYEACLKEGIGFGVYYSHGNDWQDGADGNYANVKSLNDSLGIITWPMGKNLWNPSPNTHAEYLEDKAYPQIKELLDSMPELRLVWFDGTGYVTEEQAFRFYKLVYDINPNVIVNKRVGFDFGDYHDAGDNRVPLSSEELTKYWETCGTTNSSWGYKSYDKNWKTTPQLLYYLINIVSKGGNYLLNIGPDGKGNVPKESANILRGIGEWLEVNGEAIYGTSQWEIINEGQKETLSKGSTHTGSEGFQRIFTDEEFWFTTKENKVYVICLASPEKEILVKSLKNDKAKVEAVKLLGVDRAVDWQQGTEGLKVKFNKEPKGTLGFVLEVELESK